MRWVRALTILLCCAALLVAARGLVRHNTWYLASDQFAFLTFADDLLHGRIFHDPTTTALIAGPYLPPNAAADAYYQTYIFRDGRLYSRYPPGYPMLLAAAKLVGGGTAEHWLNPLLYLLLIVVIGRLSARLGATWSGGATAAATMWTLLVIPVEVHYWGITVARDLPAHLLAFVALLCALSAAPAWAGLLLGFAASIRPDAVLWAPSVGLVLRREPSGLRAFARGTAAFAVGVVPLLAYNTITQGHPLAFTQGSEFRYTFESALLSPLALAGPSFISGGAFRLANFPTTFPAHVRYLVSGFGVFLWLGIGMLLVGVRRRSAAARALGPYVVIGLLFYSCWSHGDARYLVGVSLSLIVLASTAMVALAERLSDAGTPPRARLVALAIVVAILASGVVLPRDPARGLTTLERTAALALVAATVAGAVPTARLAAPFAPALAFAVFGAVRVATSAGTPSGFSGADIDRARSAIESVVPPGALVLASAGLGRPAENWTHYTHTDAHYLAELPRLISDANYTAHRCTVTGRPFFLLLHANEPLPFTLPPAWVSTRRVAQRDGEALRDWFVDPQRATAGVVLYEARVSLPVP